MQSVIAIIIIELMYLLRVPGKHWLCLGTGGSLCLTDAVSGIRLMHGAGTGLQLKTGRQPARAIQLILWRSRRSLD